jgi:chromatin assembly factor 1 subunit A
MANFFGKPKVAAGPSSTVASSSSDVFSTPNKKSDSITSNESPVKQSQSDFERSFYPFAVKKNVELAPINWFTSGTRRQASKLKTNENEREVIFIDGSPSEVIVIQDDEGELNVDVKMDRAEPPVDVEGMSGSGSHQFYAPQLFAHRVQTDCSPL